MRVFEIAAITVLAIIVVAIVLRTIQIAIRPARLGEDQRAVRRRDAAIAREGHGLAEYAEGQAWLPADDSVVAAHADLITELIVARHEPHRLTAGDYTGVVTASYELSISSCYGGSFLTGQATIGNAYAIASTSLGAGERRLGRALPGGVVLVQPGRMVAPMTIRPRDWRTNGLLPGGSGKLSDPGFDRHYRVTSPRYPVAAIVGPNLRAAVMSRRDWSLAATGDHVLFVRAEAFTTANDVEQFLISVEQVLVDLPDLASMPHPE